MNKTRAESPKGGPAKLQESQYEFPYHHIPRVHDHVASQIRALGWGFEYMCYLNHIREMVLEMKPKSLLDVGCGDGRFLGMLPDVPERVGVDSSDRAIQFAKAFHPEITFKGVDGSSLDVMFDVSTAIEVLEHVPDEEVADFLQTLSERTTVGGHVIICVPTVVTPLQQKHHRHYSLAVLQEQLKQANVNLRLTRADYVFRKDRIYRIYQRVLMNRWWSVEIKRLNRLLWRHVWENLRNADADSGNHLVVVLQKDEADE